jgi:N-methylhydantoinase A
MSAFGMFAMDLGLEYARSCARRQNRLDFAELANLYADMRRQACEDFARIGISEAQISYQRTVEMRYVGQFHEVEVEMPAEDLNAENLQVLLQNFHTKYEKMYTYSMTWRAAEFLTFRLKVTAPRRPMETAVHARAAAGVEAARRGSRQCLFDGSPKRVETRVYDWDRMAPGHKVEGPFACEVDQYRNLVLRSQ